VNQRESVSDLYSISAFSAVSFLMICTWARAEKSAQNLLKICSFLLIFAQNARISVNFLQVSGHFYPHFSLKNQYVL
jgi:hypothetical protein